MILDRSITDVLGYIYRTNSIEIYTKLNSLRKYFNFLGLETRVNVKLKEKPYRRVELQVRPTIRVTNTGYGGCAPGANF